MKTTYKLGSMEFLTALKEALDRLMTQTSELRPGVIVEDTVTKRFVQFAGSFTEPLLLDVPWKTTAAPKNQNVMNAMMASVLLDEPKPPDEDGLIFFQKNGSITELLQVAQYVLRDVLELPVGIADMFIEEICANRGENAPLAS